MKGLDMYKYLFGPVPSRRLGMSLGVDLVPRKVCSLDCVYCEVGKTTELTLNRREYIEAEKVMEEFEHYFISNPDPDYITFSGSGEPTLNLRIGEIIHQMKQSRPNIPIAVLTNGTLLFDKTVRNSLLEADVVLPSLDAATQPVFEKINRPAAGLSVKDHIKGIIDFKSAFKGKMWLEVLILPGYNDHESELSELKKAIHEIDPDLVQLNTLDRPGTIAGLRGASRAELKFISDYLKLEKLVIVAASAKRKNIQSYRSDTEAAIIETISRRPCTLDDLVEILGMRVAEINKYLDVLDTEGKIEAVEQERGFFYQIREK